MKTFERALTIAISRRIQQIVVLPLHGQAEELSSLDQAIAFIRGYEARDSHKPIQRYEIQIRYSNGDSIDGKFVDKDGAIEFLESYKST